MRASTALRQETPRLGLVIRQRTRTDQAAEPLDGLTGSFSQAVAVGPDLRAALAGARGLAEQTDVIVLLRSDVLLDVELLCHEVEDLWQRGELTHRLAVPWLSRLQPDDLSDLYLASESASLVSMLDSYAEASPEFHHLPSADLFYRLAWAANRHSGRAGLATRHYLPSGTRAQTDYQRSVALRLQETAFRPLSRRLFASATQDGRPLTPAAEHLFGEDAAGLAIHGLSPLPKAGGSDEKRTLRGRASLIDTTVASSSGRPLYAIADHHVGATHVHLASPTDALELAQPANPMADCMVVWKTRGVVHVLDFGGAPDRHSGLIRLIAEADTRYGLPELPPRLINTSDDPINADEPDTVIFSLMTRPGYHDVPVPDAVMSVSDDALRTLVDAGSRPAEVDKVGWTGDISGGRAHRLAYGEAAIHPDLLEIVHTTESRETVEGVAGQASRSAYLLDLGRASHSPCLKLRLHTGRPVLVPEQPSHEWFGAQLEPMVHYLPVRRDLSDLADVARWARAHPAETQAIALRGQELAQQILTHDFAVKVWASVLADSATLKSPSAPLALRRYLAPILKELDAPGDDHLGWAEPARVALLHTPLQAMNLIEYLRDQPHRRTLAVVGGATSPAYLPPTLDLLREAGIPYVVRQHLDGWKRPNAANQAAIDEILSMLPPQVGELVLGQYFRTAGWQLARELGLTGKEVVVLDDGTATLAIERHDYRDAPPADADPEFHRWQQPYWPLEDVTFFTSFDEEIDAAATDTVLPNRQDELRDRYRRLPTDDSTVFLIGQPLGETRTTVGSTAAYVEDLIRQTRLWRPDAKLVYLSHLREEPESLALIGQMCEVISIETPFELVPLQIGSLPTAYAGFLSTLMFNLADLAPQGSIEIKAYRIPSAHILPNKRAQVDATYDRLFTHPSGAITGFDPA